MNNKKIIYIVIAVVCVVIIGAVAGFFIMSKGKKVATQQQSMQDNQAALPTINPEDIGFSLSVIKSGKFANNGLDMKITKISDIASIDYELDYTSKGDIPRGAIGQITIKPTDKTVDQQLPFGTCSDVCHFDSGVGNIKLTLKITKQDGSSYQLISPFSL